MLQPGKMYTVEEISVLRHLFSSREELGYFEMMLDDPIKITSSLSEETWLKSLSNNLHLTLANNAFADQYGGQIEDVLGYTPNDFYGDNDEQGHDIISKLFHARSASQVSHEIKLDGSLLIVKGEYFLICDEKDQVAGVFGLQTDITEQVMSDKKQTRENQLLRASEEMTHSASFEWDLKLKRQEYSEGIYRIFGFSKNTKITEQNLYELIHPEDYASFMNSINSIEARSAEKGFVEEFRIIANDGKTKSLWMKVSQEHDAQGELSKIYGAIQDITERKRKEILTDVIYNISHAASDLKDFKEFYKTLQSEIGRLVDASNMFVAFYVEEGDILDVQYVTGESRKFTQLSAKGTISKLVIDENRSLLLDHETLLEYDTKGKINRIGKSSKTWLGVPLRKGNETFGVLVVQNYERDKAFSKADQALLEFISIQLVLAIRRMQDSEQIEVLRNSIEQSPASVVITDMNGDIEYVNPKFEQVTGYSFDEVRGQNPRILKSDIHNKDYYRSLWNTILNGAEWSGELQNRRKDGSTYWEAALINPVKNALGEITHFVAVKEDISARKQMEKDLLKAKDKAEESDRLKTAFLANLSHEIRTPMNGILGFSDLLREPNLEHAEYNRYVDIINSNGNQLLSIIDDIITISNLEVKQLKIRRKEIDLVAFLEEIRLTMEMERKALRKQKVKLIFPDFKEKNMLITTDESKLNQILTNLLKNALKFTESGAIKLEFKRQGSKTFSFSITDSGVGIPGDMHEVIFDRFRQVDDSNTRSFGGTGLGLAISKGLVELLGGRIWVESELGKGAIFRFTLKE